MKVSKKTIKQRNKKNNDIDADSRKIDAHNDGVVREHQTKMNVVSTLSQAVPSFISSLGQSIQAGVTYNTEMKKAYNEIQKKQLETLTQIIQQQLQRTSDYYKSNSDLLLQVIQAFNDFYTSLVTSAKDAMRVR